MTMAEYDPQNIFAKILRGDLPSETVYEDEATKVIMDIMPRTEGHALILPKNPSRNIFDIGEDDLNACLKTVQKVAKAALKAFNADGVTIQHFCESAGGQMVFHTHWHVLPRHADVPLRPHSGEVAPAEAVKAAGDKLRSALNAG
ncbi:MAG: HIT domain-containing protein [Pseudomonadota bacterium]